MFNNDKNIFLNIDTHTHVKKVNKPEVFNNGKNIFVTVNGEEVQNCNTDEMIFNTQECLSFISQTNTLEPGDIVFTGTSGVTSRLQSGDDLITKLDGLGELHNTISD